jgi:hypothetical protein
MDLYIDTEFNGHGGELISLAVAAEDGKHWYGVFCPYLPAPDPWVDEHVMPILYEMRPTVDGAAHSDEMVRFSLKEYLKAREGCTIWADWPADFEHLMRLMAGPSYAESFMIPCTMQLVVTPDGEPQPEIPHNALSDAIALMRWHQGLLLDKTPRAPGYDPDKFRGQHP